MIQFQPDSIPIFAHHDRMYNCLQSCKSARKDGSGIHFEGILQNGRTLDFVVTPVTPDIIRIRYHAQKESIDNDTPCLVARTFEPMAVELKEDSDCISLHAGRFTIRVEKSPWRMSVADGKGDIRFQQEIWDRAFVLPVTHPAGYSEGRDGRIGVYENFSLAPDEHLFGLGPKYMSVNKRGHRAVMWCTDTIHTNTTELSYMSVPFFMSSRGYGLLLNNGAKSIFELGSYSTIAGSFWVDSPLMDYFLILGDTPAEIINNYTLLAGRPAVPPVWAFGLWMSRCWYFDRATVENVVDRMRSSGIPLDVINIDPAWLKDWPNRRAPGCEFEWNTVDFPDPEGFLKGLRQKHVRVCLWENPYVPRESNLYREGKEQGYLVKKPDGSIAEPDHPFCSGMGLTDFTNPEAVEWIKEAHRRLLRQGVAAFKTDYGEGVPEDAVFHNGKTGREMHNLYPILYNRTAFEAIEEVHGEAIVFNRSGGVGSHRSPIQWAADAQCNFAGMAGSLKGGLSYALSGGAFWSHDIGGFYNPIDDGPPDPTLYIRWAQFGLLSPIARFHGRTPREPWEFGGEAVEIVRKFALLRSRLVPYLYSHACEAGQTGLPIMRPLYLEFPDDPHAPFEELEYMLGRELLIAPVFNKSGERTVYLPPGKWTDFWDGTVHRGPKHLKVNVSLDMMPIFVRENSILPLGREMQHVSEYPWDEFEVEVFLNKTAEFSLYDDNKESVKLVGVKKRGEIEFHVSASSKAYHLIFHRVRDVKEVESSGSVSDLKWSTEENSASVSFKTSGPASLRLITP